MKMKYNSGISFENKLKAMGDGLAEVIGDSLRAGMDIVAPLIKKNLEVSLSDAPYNAGRRTGEVLSSFGVTEVKKDEKGKYSIKAGFREPRRVKGKSRRKITNAMLANIIEYGSSKRNRPPRPFMIPAYLSKKSEIERAMKDVIDRYIDKFD